MVPHRVHGVVLGAYPLWYHTRYARRPRPHCGTTQGTRADRVPTVVPHKVHGAGYGAYPLWYPLWFDSGPTAAARRARSGTRAVSVTDFPIGKIRGIVRLYRHLCSPRFPRWGDSVTGTALAGSFSPFRETGLAPHKVRQRRGPRRTLSGNRQVSEPGHWVASLSDATQ